MSLFQTKESHMTLSTSGPSMHRDVILPSSSIRQSHQPHPSKNRASNMRPEGISNLVHSPLQGLNLTVHSSVTPPVEYRTSNQSVAPSTEHLANNCVSNTLKPNFVPPYFNSNNNTNPRLASSGHTFDLLGYNSTPLKFINEVEKEIRLPNVNPSLKPGVRGSAHTDNVAVTSNNRSNDPNYYSPLNCEQTVVLDLQKRPTKHEDATYVSSAGFTGSMNYLVGSNVQGAPVTLASISRMDPREPDVSQPRFCEERFREKLQQSLSSASILSSLTKEDGKFHAANLIAGSVQPNGGGTQHGLTREFADKVYNFGFGTMRMSSKHSLDDSSDSKNLKRSRMMDVQYVGSEGTNVPSSLANYLQSSMASSTAPPVTTVASSRVPVNQNSKNFQQAYACYIKVEGGLAPAQLLPNAEQLETKQNSFQNLIRGNVPKSDSTSVRSVARQTTDEMPVQNSAESEVTTKVIEESSLAWNNGPPVVSSSPLPQNIAPPITPSPTLKCHAGCSSTPGSASSMMETFGATNGGDSDTQSAHSPATLPKTGDSEPSTPRSPQSHSGSRLKPCSIRNNIKKQWLQKYKEEDEMKDTTSGRNDERRIEKDSLDGTTVASGSIIVETEKNDSSHEWNSSSELVSLCELGLGS